MKWIGYRYAYVLSLSDLSPPPTLDHPLGHHGASIWAPWAIQQFPTIYFMDGCVYMLILIFHFMACSFPTMPHRHPHFHMSVFVSLNLCSISVLQLGSSVQFFSRFHKCTLLYLFFSSWLLSLCMINSRSSHIPINQNWYAKQAWRLKRNLHSLMLLSGSVMSGTSGPHGLQAPLASLSFTISQSLLKLIA